MTIVYDYNDSLYINMTNKCPCACIFCIRREKNHVGNSDNLWLKKEPTVEEVIEEIKKVDMSKYEEVVFCGYGEPLERIEEVVEVSKFLKDNYDVKVRVNTNGLADLIHKRKTAQLLKNNVDAISISLNAPNKERYNEIVKPKFGEESFEALLQFARDCKEYVKEVNFSLVDIISEEEIEEVKKLAEDMNIPLRVRHKSQ